MLQYIVAGLLLLVLVALLWDVLKHAAGKLAVIAVNSVAGLLILYFLNVYVGWRIPISLPTLVICGLFGIPGVATLVILYLFRMI